MNENDVKQQQSDMEIEIRAIGLVKNDVITHYKARISERMRMIRRLASNIYTIEQEIESLKKEISKAHKSGMIDGLSFTAEQLQYLKDVHNVELSSDEIKTKHITLFQKQSHLTYLVKEQKLNKKLIKEYQFQLKENLKLFE